MERKKYKHKWRNLRSKERNNEKGSTVPYFEKVLNETNEHELQDFHMIGQRELPDHIFELTGTLYMKKYDKGRNWTGQNSHRSFIKKKKKYIKVKGCTTV